MVLQVKKINFRGNFSSIFQFKGNEKEIYKGFAEKINKIRENGTVNIYETVVSD